MKGTDITTLQTFLISQGYLASGNTSGYFGNLTQQAVKAFQKKQGIVSSGSPATTGYGMVGVRTRTAINKIIQSSTSSVSTTTETPEQTLARLQALLKQLQQMQGQR
jgi:peptidoglycan hydrolase-like protein with peptidoglycan-binding domain